MDITFWIIGIIVFLVLGYFIGLFKAKSAAAKENGTLSSLNQMLSSDKEKLAAQLKESQSELTNLKITLSKRERDLTHLTEKLDTQKKDLTDLQEKFTKEFENLAQKILEKNADKFSKQSKDSLKLFLNPLKLQIDNFQKKVEETNKDDIKRNATLIQKINSLESLNQQMSKDAINLTNALKGESKTQGDWGELQLEVLLEKSGLSKEIHFTTQGGFRDEDGLLKKPDFIINLPDNKKLIIDSKVSLTAYESYFNAENDNEQKLALKNHLLSIRKHFKELGDKNYTDLYGINTPDYVMMFVPIEPALMIALHEENKIYLEALDKNVVLVSTSTLLATLSTVASIWKQEDQKRNVLEIAKESGLLYDKFEGFVQDLLKVGKALNTSQESYQLAMNKLSTGRGNLVNKIENIKKLGAKTKKSLPDKLLERASE